MTLEQALDLFYDEDSDNEMPREAIDILSDYFHDCALESARYEAAIDIE